MGSDGLRALRQALHVGDGTAALAAVEASGMVGSLQLIGDLLLIALADDAVGAREFAERCAGALRARDWGGDEELAAALDAARGHRAAEPLTEITVDLEELANLLDSGPDSLGGRIDLISGEVWPEFALEEAWPGDEEALEDEDRWLYVSPAGSRAAYQDMVDFIATRQREELVARLKIAVDGRGAFRRFKNVLADWPEDREDWFACSEDRSRGRARAWLSDAGYRPAVRRCSAASRIEHRVELSAVVSKYIGETEKNLRRLFDAAEDGGAVLLFDEADALFGEHRELLERIAADRGLTIHTTAGDD